MKRVKEFILQSCGYTVLIAFLLYAVLAISGVTDQGIPILKFLAVFGYGLLTAAAGLAYRELPIKKLLRLLIHYSILLLGFVILYLASGAARENVGAKVFVAVVIFTILYAIAAGVIAFIYRARADLPSEKKEKLRATEEKKPAYKSRVGGEDQ